MGDSEHTSVRWREYRNKEFDDDDDDHYNVSLYTNVVGCVVCLF